MHETVLKKESIEALDIDPNGCYIDLTGGGGGHSEEIMLRLSDEGRLVIFEQDLDAMERLKKKFKYKQEQIIFVRDNFANLISYVKKLQLKNIDGMIMDLGMSSDQLESNRGFSFKSCQPLDMRMDQETQITAQDIVNNSSKEELKKIFKKYGEVSFAGKLANQIIFSRKRKQIETTEDLRLIIEKIMPFRKKIHPATQVFQALRIVVNKELESLEKVLQDGITVLAEKGRWVVISFHSLEDRIVKMTFNKWAMGCKCPKSLPQCVCNEKPIVKLVWRKPQLPSAKEIQENPRSRSAKMRCLEKIKIKET